MQRFYEKAKHNPETGCLEWTAAMNNCGYGKIKLNGEMVLAHRVAWELAHGPVPKGLCVCHTCDNPACVEPSHLFLGTHSENMRDAFKKGRVSLPNRWIP